MATNAYPLLWIILALALGVVAVAWAERRRQALERRALETALGHLAEFRLPLPDPVKETMPPVLHRLVRGYDDVFTEMLRRERALAERLERFAFMEMHTEDMLMQADEKGVVKYISPAAHTQLGYVPEELRGTRILDLLHPDDLAHWVESLKRSARERKGALLEGRWRSKDGRYVALELSLRHAYGLNGKVAGTISMARNVEARNALRDRLTRAAQTDQLTGLPNRAALADSLREFRAASEEQPFVLFLFDLDRFKQVNDSLGHAAGDEYLIETANRVRSILRPGDTLARMGGDEFVALFKGIDSHGGARSIAARIIDAVSQPYSCHGALLHPKTSIGIVLCDDPELASDELISRADRAMYAAKRQGGNLAIVYNEGHTDSLRKDFSVEQALSRALEHSRLVVHFQPVVDAKTKRPVLSEVLVRMLGDDGALLGPGHFIDVAEKTGQIMQVGQWVLEQACWQARRLEEGGRPTPISVNVSPRQLLHVNFARSVETVLEQTGVSPSSIVLEVTESAVMEDVEKAKATLNHLRSLGFRLALDDFGTGYSSISMLKALPFDILKIDRSFVRDSEGLSLGPSLLGAIIDIGKSLKLTIIAEGIETAAQSLHLECLGCDLLQGFHFFRPLDAQAHFEALSGGLGQLRIATARETTVDEMSLFEPATSAS
ncbi:putative bifunctional diguanylate cyclase/phosphodiesterase [Piscinibacter sp.]|uniref:putative bifunctional diguanylate cyclase/phosphodiesterase n=1 Tax=Piscinibacter sp. TaxID=1903157 RepID=UPI002D00B49F|nr:EAL domain-containing protein [Albitalea sp.]HUG21332.1 EAL domain-containing protein [Albitalea sp.]